MDAKRKLLKISIILLVGLIVVAVLGGDESASPSLESPTESAEEEASINTAEERVLTTVREFTALEFKQAYDNLSLPNITPIVVPPSITGSDAADERIRMLAEARGYQLRDVSSGLLNEIDGKPVQELLITDWGNLQQMAREEGVSIEFVSGYRSIEDQAEIFLSRLYATGVTNETIASGASDDQVTSVLTVTAPPGYSRHHSGYTIDVEDPGFAIFGGSTAYAWISANNFEKAKIHGFIPSYPEGLTNQGPNPEPWEFVWVGETVTYE